MAQRTPFQITQQRRDNWVTGVFSRSRNASAAQARDDAYEVREKQRAWRDRVESRFKDHRGRIVYNEHIQGLRKFARFVRAYLESECPNMIVVTMPVKRTRGHVFQVREYQGHTFRNHKEMSDAMRSIVDNEGRRLDYVMHLGDEVGFAGGIVNEYAMRTDTSVDQL
ncbi:hypothetical protein C5167_031161 [Papaver somniferum]|uniref:uncharacterized protein LOC113333906 n=1 Tax=Papaver somniferum TaxID=3469 RepID=UPI000E6FE2D0|nr:uncharacterized protein LOC113333906 [Papaver somniferum]RZC88787.1 hypothetical protein C5167_031161 [Papaver somniferum]